MERAVVLPMAVACIVTTPLGILAIHVLDPAQGRRLIGAVVLARGLALLAGLRRNGVARLLPTTLVGGAGGILNGLAGMGGPPPQGLVQPPAWSISGRPTRAARPGSAAHQAKFQTKPSPLRDTRPADEPGKCELKTSAPESAI